MADNGITQWIVVWEDGRTEVFSPYASLGMTNFILTGLERGRVTVDGDEVESFYDPTFEHLYWRVKVG